MTTYYAALFKEQGGFKMSTLKIIPDINIHILKPLQWRQTDIKPNEFEGINRMWMNECKPQSNWTIERWLTKLNHCIKNYRNKQIKKINPIIKKSPLKQEVTTCENIEVIKPIEFKPITSCNSINSKPVASRESIKIIKPNEIIEPINSKSKTKNGIEYEAITNDLNPLKQIYDTILIEVKNFIVNRLDELQKERGLNLNCEIDLDLAIYWDN